MTTTANLGLSLPESNDYADISVLNANFQKLDTVVSAAKSAEEYNAAGTYAVGDYCTKDGKLYKCTTAITAAEAWNAAHWAETTVGGEFAALYTALAGKAAANHSHTPAQIGAAAAAHNHDASAITSGILSAARGGTGVSSLAALATALGAARIASGSYTGTGTYGSEGPCVVRFDFQAKLFVVRRRDFASGLIDSYIPLIFNYPSMNGGFCVQSTSKRIIVSWDGNYQVSWYSPDDYYSQHNISGMIYDWVAIG